MLNSARAAAATVVALWTSLAPVMAEELTGTLEKAKKTGAITIGYRESSVPFSYLDGAQKPVGFALDLCAQVVDAVKDRIAKPDLRVVYTPVNSSTRIPLVANGTVDLECGTTANQRACQKQVAFSVSTFVPQFRWLTRTAEGVHSTADLKGKTVVVTAGTNTAQFVNKLDQDDRLNLNILTASDHAQSFLLVESGRASAFMEDDINLAGLRANAKDPEMFTILQQAYPSDVYALMFRRDDPEFKALVDHTLIATMQSGLYERLYAKWFESAIPPRGENLKFPMSDKLKSLIEDPSDQPNN